MPFPSALSVLVFLSFFFFNDTATTEIYTLSLHDALPIWYADARAFGHRFDGTLQDGWRSEEHTSELQSRGLISYAVFCLKKQKTNTSKVMETTPPREPGNSQLSDDV